MVVSKGLRLAMIGSMLALPMLMEGCGNDERDAGVPSAKATAATERGGGVTTASPGGPNVAPTEGTGAGVR